MNILENVFWNFRPINYCRIFKNHFGTVNFFVLRRFFWRFLGKKIPEKFQKSAVACDQLNGFPIFIF